MKQSISFIMILCLLLSGCTLSGERIKEPVTFYYLRSDYNFFAEENIFVSEEKEASGHREDLSYLLRLYQMGPSSEELISPLPRGTKITLKQQTERSVRIEMSGNPQNMTDIDYSLACSCIALTCFDLTNANTVIITNGERSLTLTRDTLILYDTNENPGEEPQ